jgi:hypothetical protein
MQAEMERPDLVRCLGCHAVYEQPDAPIRPEEATTCPACGHVAWLAASIPVEETGAVTPA